MANVSRHFFRCPTILLFTTAVLGLAHPLQANGPNIGREGGAIFPLRTDSIQLVNESVVVDLSEDFAAPTRCEYLLRNLKNETQTIEMSFLVPPAGSPGNAYDAVETYASTHFVVTVKGEQIPIEMLTPKPGAWAPYSTHTPEVLPVWKVSFGPKEEARVDISYVSAWGSERGEGRHHQSYKYHARVASLWAGLVEYAVIVFELGSLLPAALQATGPSPNDFKYVLSPKDFNWKDFGVVWERRDWEPTEDFEISFEYKSTKME